MCTINGTVKEYMQGERGKADDITENFFTPLYYIQEIYIFLKFVTLINYFISFNNKKPVHKGPWVPELGILFYLSWGPTKEF